MKIVLDDLELDLNTSNELINTLRFYADPTTYFAIGFFPDPPNGQFMDDFDDTGFLGMKPGKRARHMMQKLAELAGIVDSEEENVARNNLPEAGFKLDETIAWEIFGEPRPDEDGHNPDHIDPIEKGVWFCHPDYYNDSEDRDP